MFTRIKNFVLSFFQDLTPEQETRAKALYSHLLELRDFYTKVLIRHVANDELRHDMQDKLEVLEKEMTRLKTTFPFLAK